VVMSPNLQSKAMAALEQLENDPKYAKRYKEIIDKKRLEWRDREAARKLVG
jgi:hypothetical protein